MKKSNFLASVRAQASGLPREDLEKLIEYYSEMIDDRMEEGMTEEEAVASVGTAEEIAAEALKDAPKKTVNADTFTPIEKPRRGLRAWEIVLLIVGSPIWLPLLLAAVILIIALYIVLWSVVIVFWSADLAFAAGALSGLAGTLSLLIAGDSLQAFLFLGMGLFCTGAAIAAFFGCLLATKGIIKLAVLTVKGIASGFRTRRSA